MCTRIDRDGLIGRAKRRFAGEKVPPGFTARLLTRDGTVRFCEFIVDLVMYQGAPAILGIARDITERRRVEEALQKSEEKYRELVEDANSIILKMDKTGNVTFFNEFAQRFFGYTNDEIHRKTRGGDHCPGNRIGIRRNLRTLLDDIVRNPGPYLFNENENITRDGKRVWIRWHNKPLLDRDGQPAGVLSIGTDITGRRQAEEALQESEEKYRRIIENLQDAYIRSDENGVITMVSPSAARIFGYGSPEEMVGLPTTIPVQQSRTAGGGGPDTAQGRGDYRFYPRRAAEGQNDLLVLDECPVHPGRGRPDPGLTRVPCGTSRSGDRWSTRYGRPTRSSTCSRASPGTTSGTSFWPWTVLSGCSDTRTPDPSLEHFFSRITAASTQIANLIEFTNEYEKIGVHAPAWQDIRAPVDDAAWIFPSGRSR